MAARLKTGRSAQNSTRNRSSKNASEMEEDARELLHAKRIYDKKDLIRTDFNASLQGSIDTESNRMNEGKVSNIQLCLYNINTSYLDMNSSKKSLMPLLLKISSNIKDMNL